MCGHSEGELKKKRDTEKKKGGCAGREWTKTLQELGFFGFMLSLCSPVFVGTLSLSLQGKEL